MSNFTKFYTIFIIKEQTIMTTISASPSVGMIIIGDEILSGKRQDKHFSFMIEALAKRGLELKWCRIIGDDPDIIVETLLQTYASGSIVFCFGGIGATPDDHTRQCAAQAADLPLIRHPEAVAAIEEKFGAEAYPKRILMAELPQGSDIIPNPYNQIPGFSLLYHHFVPGFPEMAWPMVEWILTNHYFHLIQQKKIEALIKVEDAYESQLLELMQTCVSQFPSVRFSSLPHLQSETQTRYIEFGFKGLPEDVEKVTLFFTNVLAQQNFVYHTKNL